MSVSILIPVGPNPVFKDYLPEAIESVLNQTVAVDEIVLIDDDANLEVDDSAICTEVTATWDKEGVRFTRWKNPCHLGFTASHNIGMAIARNDLVIYLASDDRLLPTCVEETIKCYEEHSRKDAWYAYTYRLSTGESCHIPMNAAMITKGLWKMVGGYPPSGFVGADAMILSILMKHAPERIIKVRDGEPLYWHRIHNQQETTRHTARFWVEMNSIRQKETREFKFK